VYADLDGFFRANPDITMQSVADELGISLAMMSYIRSGLRSPRLSIAIQLAERCNIPVESLWAKTTETKVS